MNKLVLLALTLCTILQGSAGDRLVVAPVGSCVNMAAYGIIVMQLHHCKQMSGRWNENPGSNDWIKCHLDWCKVTNGARISTSDVWTVCEKKNQVSSNSRTYGIVRMIREHCDALEGKYNGNPKFKEWTDCHLYWCKNSGRNAVTGVYSASVGECSGNKVAYGIIEMQHRECSKIRGKWNGNPGANDWINCHLDWCLALDCVPRDEWHEIHVCSNSASRGSLECTIQYTVGTSKTTRSSASLSEGVTVTAEVGVSLFEIFSTKLQVSSRYDWSRESGRSSTFSKETKITIKITVPPSTSISIQQVTGYCGTYRVATPHYKTVERNRK